MTDVLSISYVVTTCPYCSYRGPVEQMKMIDGSTETICARCGHKTKSYPKRKLFIRK